MKSRELLKTLLIFETIRSPNLRAIAVLLILTPFFALAALVKEVAIEWDQMIHPPAPPVYASEAEMCARGAPFYKPFCKKK
jgi:hypothetical protein